MLKMRSVVRVSRQLAETRTGVRCALTRAEVEASKRFRLLRRVCRYYYPSDTGRKAG